MTDLASSNVTDLRLECGEPADMEFVKVNCKTAAFSIRRQNAKIEDNDILRLFV